MGGAIARAGPGAFLTALCFVLCACGPVPPKPIVTTTTSTTTSTTTTTLPPPTANLTLGVGGNYTGTSEPFVVDFTSSNATSCSLTATPSVWSGRDPHDVPCNGSLQVNLPANTVQESWDFVFTAANADGQSTSSTYDLTIDAPTPTTSPPYCQWIPYNNSFQCSPGDS